MVIVLCTCGTGVGARVTRVPSAHHEEVGEYLSSSASSPCSTDHGLAADARRRHAPPKVVQSEIPIVPRHLLGTNILCLR